MFLMKHFPLFATVAMIAGMGSFFLITIETIVKEINYFDKPIPQCL